MLKELVPRNTMKNLIKSLITWEKELLTWSTKKLRKELKSLWKISEKKFTKNYLIKENRMKNIFSTTHHKSWVHFLLTSNTWLQVNQCLFLLKITCRDQLKLSKVHLTISNQLDQPTKVSTNHQQDKFMNSNSKETIHQMALKDSSNNSTLTQDNQSQELRQLSMLLRDKI